MERDIQRMLGSVLLFSACGVNAGELPERGHVQINARFVTTAVDGSAKLTPRFLAETTHESSTKQDVLSCPTVTVVDGKTAIMRTHHPRTSEGEGAIVVVTPRIFGDRIRLKGTAWLLNASGKVGNTRGKDRIEWYQGSSVRFTIRVESSRSLVGIASLPCEENHEPRQLEIQLSAVRVDGAGNPE